MPPSSLSSLPHSTGVTAVDAVEVVVAVDLVDVGFGFGVVVELVD